jgi:hypothetical protein
MKSRLKYYIIILFLFLNRSNPAGAQILSDTTTLKAIKSGIDFIYRLKFDEAQEIFNEIDIPGNEHPVIYLLRGLTIYWENYPLLPNTDAMNDFEANMRRCIELCEMKPYSEDYEAEALLANVCARGLLLVFYADNHMSWNVIPLATGTYKYIMRSFDFNKVYSDLYYFTGIYNYYREAYPAWHPVYKPVAALFPPGDIETGLRELNICAQKSILLRAEANSILSWIYTNYENNYETALMYTGSLTNMYPENLFFRALHIKNLLLLGKYDEAERLLELSPEESNHNYYGAQVKVFSGIIQEKKYRNPDLAADLYENALYELVPFGNYGNEFSAYCYFGLSRISDVWGDKAGKRTYHRKAMNLASFKKINFD